MVLMMSPTIVTLIDMTLEADFTDCFVDVVSWQSRTGQDTFGNDAYATAANVSTRIDSDVELFGTSDRQDMETGANRQTLSLIMAVNSVTVRDLVTVNSVVFTVTDVAVFRDEDGDHHQVVTATSDKKD